MEKGKLLLLAKFFAFSFLSEKYCVNQRNARLNGVIKHRLFNASIGVHMQVVYKFLKSRRQRGIKKSSMVAGIECSNTWEEHQLVNY